MADESKSVSSSDARKNLEQRAKQRGLALHDARDFLSAIIENIPDMVFVKDAQELRFVLINKAGEALLGRSRDELLGKNDHDLFPKEQADFFTAKDREVLATGSVADISEEPIETPGSGIHYLHTKKIPIYTGESEPKYLLGISEDITDQKRAAAFEQQLSEEQQARQAAEDGLRSRDQFVSFATHDLKTPLTALQLNLQLALQLLDNTESGQTSDAKSVVERAHRASQRFTMLVDRMLDFSRITQSRLVLCVHDTDLSQMVRRVTELFEPEMQDAGCRLHLDIPDTVKGCWDGPRIEEVLMNLVSNAVKFGRGKPVEIWLRPRQEHVELGVRDHGIGISEEQQKHLFEMFYRAAPQADYPGMGIGLYMSREIVRAHGGSIHVESRLGRGATVFVRLPYSAA